LSDEDSCDETDTDFLFFKRAAKYDLVWLYEMWSLVAFGSCRAGGGGGGGGGGNKRLAKVALIIFCPAVLSGR